MALDFVIKSELGRSCCRTCCEEVNMSTKNSGIFHCLPKRKASRCKSMLRPHTAESPSPPKAVLAILPASKLEGGRALPHFDTSPWLEFERLVIGVDLPRDPSTPTLLRYPSDQGYSHLVFFFFKCTFRSAASKSG